MSVFGVYYGNGAEEEIYGVVSDRTRAPKNDSEEKAYRECRLRVSPGMWVSALREGGSWMDDEHVKLLYL